MRIVSEREFEIALIKAWQIDDSLSVPAAIALAFPNGVKIIIEDNDNGKVY